MSDDIKMTVEQAVDCILKVIWCKGCKFKSINCMARCHGRAEEILNKCADKQIPKKPRYEPDRHYFDELIYDTWICPNCNHDYEVDCEKHDYCPNCGQKIDWREENDND